MLIAMKKRTALVVGGGIGGPVLGMFLQRLDYEVVIVEARDSIADAEGAFLGVAPNGMNVLDALGLLNSGGLPRAHVCASFRFANHADRFIGSIDRSRDREDFTWPLSMVRRADLHTFLSHAARERGLAIRYGQRLVSIDRTRSNLVVAQFADGTRIEADLLIGCDGLRSATRSLVLPDAPAPRFSELLDVGGFARVPGLALEPGVNLMVFGKRAFFGAFNTTDGETWWFHNGPPAEITDLRAHLLALHAGDPAWIADVIRATPAILGPWPLHELDAMPRWSDGRVCLMGDAAHAMSPSAGQGASMAMEDAMVLAQCLRDIDEVPAAFSAFERIRRPRVDAIAKAAAQQSNNKAPSAMGAWFRDRMLPMFLKLGSKQQRRAYGHRIEWADRVGGGLEKQCN